MAIELTASEAANVLVEISAVGSGPVHLSIAKSAGVVDSSLRAVATIAACTVVILTNPSALAALA